MKKKLIDLHFEWIETGTMGKAYSSGGGLCNEIPPKYKECLDLFYPSDEDFICFDNDESEVFWASGLASHTIYPELSYSYTPRRQSIVLLICAMHG